MIKIISMALLAPMLFAGCSLLKNQDNQAQSQVTASAVNAKITAEAEKLSEIEGGGDISKCEQLTMEGFRRQCEVNIQREKEAKPQTPPAERAPKPPRT